ncbi:hypothetical protein Rhein_0618 [Rheinheimera sp. A13L]|nr:hypothetical protein [Rheinheimera sp. A13L]EGM79230.1 hypothetical protein Rhein_0618 [Rheinheimera sp. A13L]
MTKTLFITGCSSGIGHGAFTLPLLARLMPQKWLDKLLSRKFKLSR